jgi:hypothetical protein
MKKIIIVLIIVLIIPVCLVIIKVFINNPYDEYKYLVDNQSDSVIFVTFQFYGIEHDTIIINKKTSSQIFKYEILEDKDNTENTNTIKCFHNLNITTDTINKQPIKKNYHDMDLWKYSQKRVFPFIKKENNIFGKKNNIYTLEINNNDL